MIFDYPYTDMHELNLDWFLAKFKEYYEHIIEQDEKIASLDDIVTEFTNFVNNYFDNLDVQAEINNKLNVMVADGTLKALMEPYYDEITSAQTARIADLETTAVSLQNQINEIVAPDPDPSLAEVATARVNLEGVVYPTLKARLDSDAQNVVNLSYSVDVINDIVGIPTSVIITSLGYFDTTDLSSDTSNNSRGRSPIFHLPDGSVTMVSNNSGYQFSLYEQTISGGVQTTSRINPSIWDSSPITFTAYADRNYRIMVRRTDQASMLSDLLRDITFTFNLESSDTNIREILEEEPLKYYNHGVPVFTDKEVNLISAVNNDIDENTIVFAVAADNHYNSFNWKDCKQPAFAKRMAKIAKDLNVDFIVNLGDIIEGFNDYISISDYHQQYVNSSRLMDMILSYTAVDIPFMYTAGHHERYPIDEAAAANATLDYGTPFVQNSAFRSSEIKPMAYGVAMLARLNPNSANSTGYRKFTGKVVDITDPNSDINTLNNTGASLTYYFDVEKNGTTTRFLVVDGTFFTQNGYSPDTVSFVESALQDAATNSYNVVVFNHIPLRWSEYDKRPGHNPRNAVNEDAFIAVLKNSGANIIAYIHGHIHADNVVTSTTEDTDSGTYPYSDIPFPMIGISCQRIYGSSGPYIGNYTQYGTRNVSTYSAYCFDIVALHTDTGVLDFYRFGAGDGGTYPTRTVQGNI